VLLREGRIARITTAMTGELYALLRRHSILGRLMPAGEDAFDVRAFDAGLERSAQPGGLLHHLFGVRTTALFGQQAGEGLPAYLSGLLVGHELRESAPFASGVPASPVHLVGNDRLLAAYAHALARLGIAVECHPEELAARGLHGLWRHRAAAA
jgi:2-dehydro-3-deoxygalactonokinase